MSTHKFHVGFNLAGNYHLIQTGLEILLYLLSVLFLHQETIFLNSHLRFARVQRMCNYSTKMPPFALQHSKLYKNSQKSTLPPHIFMVADMTHQAMIHNKNPQVGNI